MTQQGLIRAFVFGPFRLDCVTHTLSKNGEKINAEPRHIAILKCLIEHRPEVVRCTDPELAGVFAAMGSNDDQKQENFRKYMSQLKSLMGSEEYERFIRSRRKETYGDAFGGYSFVGTDVFEEGDSATHAPSMEESQIMLFSRDQVDRFLERPETRIAKAREEVWISGNDNAHVGISLSNFVEDALRDGKRVRLLGVQPTPSLVKMLALIDPRFVSGDFKEQVDNVTKTVKRLYDKYPGFEYRLLPILPAQGFFIIDPHLPTRNVKVEIYTARPWSPTKSRPHLLIPQHMPRWQEFFIQQFENYWGMSECPFAPR